MHMHEFPQWQGMLVSLTATAGYKLLSIHMYSFNSPTSLDTYHIYNYKTHRSQQIKMLLVVLVLL